MEPEVWVIVRDTKFTNSIGESSNEPVLAYHGSHYPAFTSEKAAQSFINNFLKHNLRAQRLELREE
jgi:hypothetical protein